MGITNFLENKGEGIDVVIKGSNFYGLYQFVIETETGCVKTSFYYVENDEFFKKILLKLFHKQGVKSVSYTKLSEKVHIIEDYDNVSDLPVENVKEYLEVARIGARYVNDNDFCEILKIINKAIDRYNNN
jgi:hypothetical protein